MNVDRLLAESLLEDCVASRRGVTALLHFWRRFRDLIPARARFDDASLQYLQSGGAFHHFPLRWDEALAKHVPDDWPTNEEETADLMFRRHLWNRILPILDQPDDTQAIDALYAIVNGPDAAHLQDFFFSFSQLESAVDDPVFIAYCASFYVPYLRHGQRHLR